jgi:hypothetical protein
MLILSYKLVGFLLNFEFVICNFECFAHELGDSRSFRSFYACKALSVDIIYFNEMASHETFKARNVHRDSSFAISKRTNEANTYNVQSEFELRSAQRVFGFLA